MKTITRTAIAVFSFLLYVGSVNAEASFEGTQNGLTRSSFDLFGGALSDITLDDSGRVYATFGAPNGVFCLENGSSEWTDPPAGSDFGSVAAVATGASPGTAFVIGGTSLFRTTDGCATWTELTGSSGDSQFNEYGFRLAFGHGTLLVESRVGGLDRSVDNGESFTAVTVVDGAQEVSAIAVSPTSGEFFTLINTGSETTLFRSNDSGANWTDTGKSGSYADVAVDPSNANRIAISTSEGGVELSLDGGSTWNTLSPPPTSIPRLEFIGTRLYKGDAFTDDTISWSLLGETTAGADIVAPIAGNTTILYVGTEAGIAVSNNNGGSFTNTNNGIYAITVQDIAQQADKNIVFLATAQGLATTTNFLSADGPTWVFPVQVSESRAHQAVASIHIDRLNSNRLYAGLLGGEMYFSADGGSSWTMATIDSIDGADISDIEQTDDGTLYAAFHARGGTNTGGVLQSLDNGANWAIISSGFVDIKSNSLAVIGNTIFVGTGSDFDRTNPQNGVHSFDGNTWTKLSGAVDGQLVEAIVSIGDTLIAASAADSDESGGVFRSTDGGATWTEVTANGLRNGADWYRTLAVDPRNTDIIFVAHGRPAGPAEIYYSQDQGVTWGLLYEGLIDEVPAVMLVDDLTIGSGIGFTGISVTEGVKLRSRIVNNALKCTLKSGKSGLAGQKISLEVKRKKKPFKRKKTKTSSKKGKASFPLKRIKNGSRVRCLFITETSPVRRVRR